jgi:pSer/pThr/pTyr-binding forkhead associated (FHA) protein
MVKLDLKCRSLIVKEHHLQDGDIRSIGRDTANHIVIEDPQVSRKHAGISRLGDRLFLWDEGSKHGTFINGVRVICGELGDGDLVSIGADYSLVVTISLAKKKDSTTAISDAPKKFADTA